MVNHGKFVVSIGNLYYISIDCYLAFRVINDGGEDEGWKNVYEVYEVMRGWKLKS